VRIVPLIPARRTGVAEDSAPLTVLAPYPPPCEAARRRWKPAAFTNMDNCSRWGAEDVQLLVMRGNGCTVAGLVFFVVGHSPS
jgi:hypothetical protein